MTERPKQRNQNNNDEDSRPKIIVIITDHYFRNEDKRERLKGTAVKTS